MKLIKDFDKKKELLDKVSNYEYVLNFSNKAFKSILLNNISCNDFFYFYDKGEPLYKISPRNITLKSKEYYNREIEPVLTDKMFQGIFYQDWKQSDCMTCFKAYGSKIKDYVVKLIKNDSLVISTEKGDESIDLSQLITNLNVKILKI